MARRAAVDPIALAYLDGLERPFVQQRILFDFEGKPLPTPRWGILYGGRFYLTPSLQRAREIAAHRAYWDGGRWLPPVTFVWPHTSVRTATRRPR